MTEEELIRIEALALAVYALDVALNSGEFEVVENSPVTLEQGLVGVAKVFENYIVNGDNNSSSKG